MRHGDIAERLAAVRARIARAAERVGRRPEEIQLVGISKRQPAGAVVAALRAGLRHVGESYVQEALEKLPRVRAELEGSGAFEPPCWHFVGRLQRNKAAPAAAWFDVVETLDRTALGAALEQQAARLDRRLRVLVQVNVSGEAQKGGATPEQLAELLERSREWPHLTLVGLMAIPAAQTDPERTRPAFAKLRELRDALRSAPGGEQLHGLSMGMSGDFEVAIEEGSTSIRVGTAIFGPREV